MLGCSANSATIGIFDPVEIWCNVSVIILFRGWIVALRRILIGEHYSHLLIEMSDMLEETILTRLPHYTVHRTRFARIPTEISRVFLGASAGKRTDYATINANGFDRDQPSLHYANCTDHRVRALKVTALVDVETLYITDIQSSTSKKHDARLGPQVARVPADDLRSIGTSHRVSG